MSIYGSVAIEPHMLFSFYLLKNKTIICIVYLKGKKPLLHRPIIATRSVWWPVDAGCRLLGDPVRLSDSSFLTRQKKKKRNLVLFFSLYQLQTLNIKRESYKVPKGNKHIGNQSWNTNWTILQQKDAITAINKRKRKQICPLCRKTLRCARNI